MEYTFREPYILLKQYTSKQGFGNGHPAITLPLLLPHPHPDYGRTSYISNPDKTHSPMLQDLLITDYGRTSYSKTILPFFGPNLAP